MFECELDCRATDRNYTLRKCNLMDPYEANALIVVIVYQFNSCIVT